MTVRRGMVVLGSLLLLLLLVYAGGIGALYLTQRSLVFRANPARADVTAAEVPELREVRVTAADGLSVLAWYRPPRPGRPTLAYLHGNGGNLSNRIPRIRHFAGTGWGLLFLEYRGYGGNPGSPSEEGFVADARGAMGYLRDEGIPAERVVLYGESIGTGVATRIAAEQPVAALLLESPYTSIAAIAQARYPYAPINLLMRDPFQLLPHLAAVRAPMLVMQGGRDLVVPPAMGQAVFAAARDPKQFWAAPDAGHNDLMAHGAADAVARFVAQHVPGG